MYTEVHIAIQHLHVFPALLRQIFKKLKFEEREDNTDLFIPLGRICGMEHLALFIEFLRTESHVRNTARKYAWMRVVVEKGVESVGVIQGQRMAQQARRPAFIHQTCKQRNKQVSKQNKKPKNNF